MIPPLLVIILLAALGTYLPGGVPLDSKSAQLGGLVILVLVILALTGLGLLLVGLILSPDLEQ